MTWQPELQPRLGAPDKTIMEWLTRSFRKISDWSKTRVPAGSGSLYLASPVTVNQALTTTFVKLTAFDTEMDGLGIEVDKANHTMAIKERGRWYWEFRASGVITPFSTNAPQTIEISLYNETQNTSYVIGYFSVPRYSEVFTINTATLKPVPTIQGAYAIGDVVSLWIRQRYATPAITVQTLEELEMSAFRVGEWIE